MLKGFIQRSKNLTPEFQPNLSWKDRWWDFDDAKLNFLKIIEEKRKNRLTENFEKLDPPYLFSKNGWGEKILNIHSRVEAKSFHSNMAPSFGGSSPPDNKYVEERRILETFKLLQLKRDELYKELFMGIRFSFHPLRGQMFFEMNATPSLEKGSALTIPF
ncbi:MAG: hypothetical protein HXY44_09605 [Syntrophaceae bacterium]|nr:hypothetical protein [Syntrophaceae bacterium]